MSVPDRITRVRELVRHAVRREAEPDVLPELITLTPEDRRYLTTLYDDSVPLPPGAEAELVAGNPRLQELRASYAAFEAPVTVGSRWRDEHVQGFLDLRWFRGETLITWHYRELPRITALKYFVYAQYIRERDDLGLLQRLSEDGRFGCWTYDYPGYGTYSRDLLESVGELSFLQRALSLSERQGFRVLDIGAGYGRLAHRMIEAFPGVGDYCCVDAIPESTFLCEYYLRHREQMPPARVVGLPEVPAAFTPGSFDLAINIHSFPECTYGAIEWWLDLLARLEVPRLLLIPNDGDRLLSTELDGTRRDFTPLLTAAGYVLERSERVIEDPAVRSLVRIEDHFQLYARRS